MLPLTFLCWETTVSGTSTTLVAEIFIPFFRPKASSIWPSTLNFWPSGIVNCWFLPFSMVRMTEVGGVTCHTVPVTLLVVVTVRGVLVVMVVRSSFIPGFRSRTPSCWPLTLTFALSGTLLKCRKVPSSNFTTRSFPKRRPPPRSTFTSWLERPPL